MLIFYIKYREDNVDEDGIWLFTSVDERDKQFFVSMEDAILECERRNAVKRNQWLGSIAKTRDDWQAKERAWKALEGVEGFDPRKLFPYHKREWSQVEPKPTFVVDTLEVNDPNQRGTGTCTCTCKNGCKAWGCDNL